MTQIHVNEFRSGGLVAAYTGEAGKVGMTGIVTRRDGNAVLVHLGFDHQAVLSCPRSEGDIAEVLGIDQLIPRGDLSWAFGSGV